MFSEHLAQGLAQSHTQIPDGHSTPTLLNHPYPDEAGGADEMDPRNMWLCCKPCIPVFPRIPYGPVRVPNYLPVHPGGLNIPSSPQHNSTHGQGPQTSRASSQVLSHPLPLGKVIAFRSAAAAIGQASRSLPQTLINGQEQLLRISLRTELQ